MQTVITAELPNIPAGSTYEAAMAMREGWMERVASNFAAQGFEYFTADFGTETWWRTREGRTEFAVMVHY